MIIRLISLRLGRSVMGEDERKLHIKELQKNLEKIKEEDTNSGEKGEFEG